MAQVLRPLLIAALIPMAGTSRADATSLAEARQLPSRMLQAHNIVRAEAGVPPLAWDPALGDAAARYAVVLALTNDFRHADISARGGAGENLWMGSRGAFSYEQMIGAWGSERRFFKAGIFPAVSRSGNWSDVGHYTQMVWPTTTRVGCAIASNMAFDYLVCRYSPAGNVEGRPIPYAASIGQASAAGMR